MPEATPYESTYAQERRNDCLLMARNLRQSVQAQPERGAQRVG